MKHFRAVVLALCLQAVTCAYPSRNDFVRQQSLEAADVADEQPERLEGDPAMDISLLSVVRRLQHQLPNGMVANEVKSQRFGSFGQSVHERQMLTDMGHLEDQLESWKTAESNLQSKMFVQASTIEKLKAEEAQALRNQQEAAEVWRSCKIFMCLLTIVGFAFCMYIARMQRSWQVKGLPVTAEPTLPYTHTAAPHMSAPEPLPVEISVPRASPPEPPPCASEAPEEAIQVMASLPRSTSAEELDLEASLEALDAPQHVLDARTSELSPRSHDDVHVPISRQPSESSEAKCEFFTLPEEPDAAPEVHTTTAEEDWWSY